MKRSPGAEPAPTSYTISRKSTPRSGYGVSSSQRMPVSTSMARRAPARCTNLASPAVVGGALARRRTAVARGRTTGHTYVVHRALHRTRRTRRTP